MSLQSRLEGRIQFVRELSDRERKLGSHSSRKRSFCSPRDICIYLSQPLRAGKEATQRVDCLVGHRYDILVLQPRGCRCVPRHHRPQSLPLGQGDRFAGAQDASCREIFLITYCCPGVKKCPSPSPNFLPSSGESLFYDQSQQAPVGLRAATATATFKLSVYQGWKGPEPVSASNNSLEVHRLLRI